MKLYLVEITTAAYDYDEFKAWLSRHGVAVRVKSKPRHDWLRETKTPSQHPRIEYVTCTREALNRMIDVWWGSDAELKRHVHEYQSLIGV